MTDTEGVIINPVKLSNNFFKLNLNWNSLVVLLIDHSKLGIKHKTLWLLAWV